jgi:hypothetical protein
VSLYQNKDRWAARRIVLKPGCVSVIAGSICSSSKRVCATRRRRGCPLGRNPKRLQKGCAQANFGRLNGQSRGGKRFVHRARGSVSVTGSACLRISACTLVRLYLRILVAAHRRSEECERERRLSAQPSTLIRHAHGPNKDLGKRHKGSDASLRRSL